MGTCRAHNCDRGHPGMGAERGSEMQGILFSVQLSLFDEEIPAGEIPVEENEEKEKEVKQEETLF